MAQKAVHIWREKYRNMPALLNMCADCLYFGAFAELAAGWRLAPQNMESFAKGIGEYEE